MQHYNNERLHAGVGYVSPGDRLHGRDHAVWEERRRKLAAAREARRKEGMSETEDISVSVQRGPTAVVTQRHVGKCHFTLNHYNGGCSALHHTCIGCLLCLPREAHWGHILGGHRGIDRSRDRTTSPVRNKGDVGQCALSEDLRVHAGRAHRRCNGRTGEGKTYDEIEREFEEIKAFEGAGTDDTVIKHFLCEAILDNDGYVTADEFALPSPAIATSFAAGRRPCVTSFAWLSPRWFSRSMRGWAASGAVVLPWPLRPWA